MENDTLISIIMCVYNEQIQWVIESVESVLNQGYSNFEFIIVLDNPENIELMNLLKDYLNKDKRIILLVNDKNQGFVKSLNRALDAVIGSYIIRIDADDVCLKDRFQKQINYMKNHNEYDLVGGNALFIDENSKLTGEKTKVIVDEEKLKKVFKYKNRMVHSTWIIKTSAIKNNLINGYREMTFVEDYDLLCRLILNGYRINNMEDYLIKYRANKNGICSRNSFIQLKMFLYCRKCFLKRMKYNKDYFSEDKVNTILINYSGRNFYDLSVKLENRINHKILKNFAMILSRYRFYQLIINIICKINTKN